MLKKCILYLTLLAAAAGLAGCKGKESGQDEVKSYTFEPLGFKENEEENISHIKVYGDYVYYISYLYPQYPDEYYEELEAIPDDADSEQFEAVDKKYADYKAKVSLYKYNVAAAEKTAVYTRESNDINIDAYAIGEDGQVTMVINESLYEETEESGTDNTYMYTYSEAGEEMSKIPLKGCFEESGTDYYISTMEIGEDKNLYAIYYCGDDTDSAVLSKISVDGKNAGKITVKNIFDETLTFDRQGNVVVTYIADDGMKYALADFENGSLGAELTGLNGEYRKLGSSGEYDILLSGSDCMYGYKEEDKTITPILSWMDCGLIGSNVQSVCAMNDGKYICGYMKADTGVDEFGLLSEGEEVSADKEVITVAGMYSDENIQQHIIDFNKSNDKYKLEYKSYDSSENPEEAFSKDIIAGNIPDIIDVSGVNTDVLIAKGMLCDLSEFLESDDVVNKDYFVDGLLDSTLIDGKQYFLAKGFSINTLAGKASELEKYKDNWNMASLIEYYKSKPEGTSLIGMDVKDYIFSTLFYNTADSYVDWNTGEVSFDGEEFRSFLEFCNSFPEEFTGEEFEQDPYSMIQEGKLLFATTYIFSSEDIALYRKMFDDDILYIGYPGVGGNGSFLTSSDYGLLAISDSSKHKEAAWEFIKSYLTAKPPVSDDQDNPYNIYNIPSSKAEFEKIVKEDMTTEEYVDEDGIKITPRDTSVGYNSFDIKIGPATEEEIETLRELIKNSAGFITSSGNLQEVVSEDASKYFSGEKSLDDTMAIIQDRMKKYVNENR